MTAYTEELLTNSNLTDISPHLTKLEQLIARNATYHETHLQRRTYSPTQPRQSYFQWTLMNNVEKLFR